ncbi:hypothetical protein ACIA2T_15810 [Amycolatopsis japonica]|uniref:hypothetical protein n=1 Tax=Amycolatopsis japonica TaxID=208439 RepID=UPI0037A95FEF
MAENAWRTFSKDSPGLPAAVRKEARSKDAWSCLHQRVRGVDMWAVSIRGTSLSAGGGASYPVAYVTIYLRHSRAPKDLPGINLQPRYPIGQILADRGLPWGLGHRTGDLAFDRAFRVHARSRTRALSLLNEHVRADTLKEAAAGWRLKNGTLIIRPNKATSADSVDSAVIDACVRIATHLTAPSTAGKA